MTDAASFIGGYMPLIVFGAVLVWAIDVLKGSFRG